MGEIIFLLVIAVLDVIYFTETFSYKKPLFDNTGGPSVFPRVILTLLLIFLIARIIQILLTKEKKHFVFKELFCGSTGVFLFSFAGFILLMEPLGMIVDTVLYLSFISHYMIAQKEGTVGTPGKVLVHIAAFTCMAAAVYWFFSGVLNVAVPKGLLGFLNF